MAELSESILSNMTASELLRCCDRSKPEVKALCEMLQKYIDSERKIQELSEQIILLVESDQ
ncbi:hypothetical protein NVP1249A_03 [Vibrio phage 1.249.A._10N.261.55.B9]|uniref:Uncharacterized protein n=2 Tax=Autolykiviridae TaxID=2184034 RepID=A0A2I7RXE4_9VIRU|nr:hypothetical protein KMD63_gp03 [Vibrio phage 1.249.A._10N.261.55.B9]AUR98297.1 hypothetical protein NVP1249A_03 [Vibrio phage 1.249.A._10N.261.55.B9]AUR98319.1 hypothetical protein NVP1249B_03 [Vibrio phage 1.249.B._10N.261.55.B9]